MPYFLTTQEIKLTYTRADFYNTEEEAIANARFDTPDVDFEPNDYGHVTWVLREQENTPSLVHPLSIYAH